MDVVRSLSKTGLLVHSRLYVGTDGRVGHRMIGVPSLILRTTGRRSGRRRPSVLIYARDGGDFALVASNHGLDRPPAWQLNIEADPAVEVQVARRRASGRARVVPPGTPEHARLWALVNANNRGRYAGYQRRTERPIPVVVVTPDEPIG
jgi:deazaflavin-dependent oxidoreductase (nitroreductase family)